MSRSGPLPSSEEESRASYPLPLPEAVIRHHGEGGLFAAMKAWSVGLSVPPVLLLTGIEGVGKREIAYFLAQWLLCERSGLKAENKDPLLCGDCFPCGECGPCKKALSGKWIDFEEIRTSENEHALKVEQFRRLKGQQGFGAYESFYRIILISRADQMTPQAANSLLKILEEPPEGWVFMLTAPDSSLVLPTIASRCQTLRLKPFSELTLKQLLSSGPNVPPDRLSLAIALSQGSWQKTLEWVSDEAWKNRSLILEFLKTPESALSPLVDWAAIETANFERLLNQLESLALDLIRWSLNAASKSTLEGHLWLNRDGAVELAAQARGCLIAWGSAASAREWWIARVEQISKARLEISAPLNRKLLAQEVLLPWLRTQDRV